jgi:hypothetical protein
MSTMKNPIALYDQIVTCLKDLYRAGEHKVSIRQFQEELEKAGFNEISVKILSGDDPSVDYDKLGNKFVAAKKNGS